MATIEYLTTKLDTILNNIFKEYENQCRKINLKCESTKQERILFSLKDVIKHFSLEPIINGFKLSEIERQVSQYINKQNKFVIKDLKNKHQVTSNMTIESYMNYRELLEFEEYEMNDIYIDKIGVYKAITILQPDLIKIFKDSTFNILLNNLYVKKCSTNEEKNNKLYKKFIYYTRVIDLLTDTNIQLAEQNHYLNEKNQILNKNIESIQQEVAKTKEMLLETIHDLINI
ncbi:putative Bro-N domain-containing protein [Yalta virus]|nr:putative Bro-N domain-containing protein [Yalta virus]